ncbi:HlyD family efflux transporter periplasmic adaptor subunit [uncultured Roseibium sp.]|uniref:HlyD family secretion protein n=1 Tax=uncultured Roseibium sp. TaxID=1936171 RepID=UPI0026287CBD|nr:HlyD family efflux transporter periplasmic adaptor subunit [uncultured Roseibium sp.]
MNNPGLFRREAFQTRQENWLGAPRLIRPVSLRVMACVGLVVTLATALLLTFGNYTHRIRLSGKVVPSSGIVSVFSPADGRIVNAPFEENSEVSRGEPVLTLDTASETEHGSTAPQLAAQLREEEKEILEEIGRKDALDALAKHKSSTRESQIREELALYRNEIRSIETYVDSLRESLDGYQTLADRGLGTDEEFQSRKERIIVQNARLQTLHRSVLELTNERADIEAELAQGALERASERGDLRRRLAQLRRERIATEAAQIKVLSAPVDGMVTAVIVKTHEMVAAHDPVLSILPHDSQPQIHLLAPARAIGFLRTGRPVVLRYSAYPHEKFGQHTGRIKSVSRVAMPKVDETADPHYRIVVIPERDTILAYGQQEPLQPGMTVEADVLLERRHLYEWILSPLIAMRNNVEGAKIPQARQTSAPETSGFSAWNNSSQTMPRASESRHVRMN